MDSNKGFTLIEIILTLLLVGVLVAVAGIGFSRVVEGFLFTKTNAATLQKGQASLSRIALELKNAESVSSGSATAITFSSYKYGDKQTRRIRLNADTIEFDDGDGAFHVLTDKVATSDGLKLQYYEDYDDSTECDPSKARVIAVTLRMQGAGGFVQELILRVAPRNI